MIKISLVILATIVLAGLVLFLVLAYMSKSGVAPGLINGILEKCPDKPLCVCSEHNGDGTHYIEPVTLPLKPSFDPLAIVKVILANMGGTLQAETENYLAYSFSSRIFGFVDDLEIRIDPTRRLVHLRSASRIGHSDMGKNRMRIEQFKDKLALKISEL